MVIGYARVSTAAQHEDRQVSALREYGIPPDNIYVDKYSGQNTERPNYQRVRNDILREGDTLVVKELDRLSRSKADIKSELEYYKQRGIRVIILNIPTTAMNIDSDNSWVLETVTNILIEVLGSIAEEERLKIRKRQAEGIAEAKKKGIKFGRKSIRKPNNWNAVISELNSGSITSVEAMKRLRLKKTTFYKLLREEKST